MCFIFVVKSNPQLPFTSYSTISITHFSSSSIRFKVKANMGLSPYSNPSDAGILYVILVKTAMSISMMKAILRSMLRVFGIRTASWEEFSNQPVAETFECRGSPSKTYMDEFRNRTPRVRYDSVSCTMNQECCVCLVEFKPDAEINHLSCGHVFHTCCLEKWLKYWNITCPLCRNHMMGGHEVEENICLM